LVVVSQDAKPLALGKSRMGKELKMRRGDWMKLNCGDTVHDRADPRHTGRVNSIHRGAARVEWNETGWTSEVPVHHLKKAKATRGFSFSEQVES